MRLKKKGLKLHNRKNFSYLDDGTLMPPPKYPPLPIPPTPQQQPMAGYDYYNQGYGNSNPPPGGLPPRGQLPQIQPQM